MLSNSFTALAILSFLLQAHSKTIDPNDCKIVFYYGPSYEDSVSHAVESAGVIVFHPKFTHNKTVLFIPDYYEPQLEGYQSHYIIDAYLRSGEVNMLFIDWGAPVVPDDQVKDPDVAALVPKITAWIIEIYPLIDWKTFDVIAYAKGVEFISNVAHDLFRKTQFRIHRTTTLAPPQELIVEGKQIDDDKDLITEFIDAIHTDIGQQGSNFSRAHVDFYPNGGTAPQPGCPEDGLCSRRRSFRYFAESVNNPYAFCGNSEDSGSKENSELEESIPMGRFCPRSARGKYFLETNDKEPFGKGC